MHGLLGAIAEQLRQKVHDAVRVLKLLEARVRRLSEANAQPLVQVTLGLERRAHGVHVEARRRTEDLWVRAEVDARAVAADLVALLELGRGLAPGEALLPLVAIAAHGGDELIAECVYHGGANAVETARHLVVLAFELSARV
jgi:hypothetical protein